jgi:hypothetical protein
MKDFLSEIRLAMGNSIPHLAGASIDYRTWNRAGCPRVWQRVEQSKDGSISVWLDMAYSYIAVQYMHEGHECLSHAPMIITTPDFIVLNRLVYPDAPGYIWRAEA